jgi:hypothetical protein
MELSDSYITTIPNATRTKYEWRETRKAAAVFENTYPTEFKELVSVLRTFRLKRKYITQPGKNKSEVANQLDEAFRRKGWREGQWSGEISIELKLMPYKKAGETKATVTSTSGSWYSGYKVDNVKPGVAIDVEWNAKDGNLDRDLAAYRALYEAGTISVGVIITKVQQDIRALSIELKRPKGFATTTTTNVENLEKRLKRGDAGGCPILVVGITRRCL